MKTNVSRRKFLGMSAMGAASAAGLSTISLATTRQAEADWFTPDKLVYVQAPAPTQINDHYTAITVGTGYGSSATALRLGESAIDTLMIEMGMLWDSPASDGQKFAKLTEADGRSMWFKNKTEMPFNRFLWMPVVDKDIDQYPGALDRVNYPNMSIFVGRGVGGGSLVNGGMAVTPPRDYFEEVLPDVDAEEMYNEFFPIANNMLGVNVIPDDYLENSQYYRYARVARDSAERTGFEVVKVPNVYDWSYMEQEEQGTVPKSALDGEVIFGNNHGKQTLDQNYIPAAIGTGYVTLRTMTKVTDIAQNLDGQYVLSLQSIDEKGDVTEERIVTCDYLFLGAGVLGTNELLLKARETGTLPELSHRIGTGWGSNGNVMTARQNHFWDYTGTKQSTIPTLGINDWSNPENPVFAEIAPLPAGLETWANLYLAITKSPERGTFSFDTNTGQMTLNWTETQSDYTINSAKKFFDKINKVNYTAYRNDMFGENKTFDASFSYHPLGGCILGDATDMYGRVKGYDRLYVTDGSLIPGSIGVNPFVTITALAERNIRTVLQEDF